MSKRKIVNEGGIIGTGEGLVNQNSKEFKELQRLIKERSGEQEDFERIQNQLLSLRFQMESYLNDDNPKELIQAGEFLEKFVEVLNIKKKVLAQYIDYKESNLSAVFKFQREKKDKYGFSHKVWRNIQG